MRNLWFLAIASVVFITAGNAQAFRGGGGDRMGGGERFSGGADRFGGDRQMMPAQRNVEPQRHDNYQPNNVNSNAQANDHENNPVRTEAEEHTNPYDYNNHPYANGRYANPNVNGNTVDTGNNVYINGDGTNNGYGWGATGAAVVGAAAAAAAVNNNQQTTTTYVPVPVPVGSTNNTNSSQTNQTTYTNSQPQQ